MSDDESSDPQKDVQRLLGRCMLRLQQYELLMKSVLAHHELAGPVEALQEQRASRVEKFADKTLGHLVEKLFETYAVAEGHDRERLPEHKAPTNRISIAHRHQITMEPQRLAATRSAIEELVSMRNDLVHHFIEHFDLRSSAGCAAAMRHLEACCERIAVHHEELLDWARSIEKARNVMASFIQTEAFHNVIVNGIAPDGSFEWVDTGIVRALREANHHMSEVGWTRLDQAISRIASSHPEQKPSTYGCRTWPEILDQSRVFDLQYRIADDGRKVAWFRQRPGR